MPFNYTVPEEKQNRQLVNELCEELGGILNWSILGLKLLRNTGFIKPRICQEAADEYRLDCDSCKEFLTDHYEIDPIGQIECAVSYGKYVEWCRNNGYYPINDRNFGKAVKRLFPKVYRCRGGDRTRRIYVYEGLSERVCVLCDL